MDFTTVHFPSLFGFDHMLRIKEYAKKQDGGDGLCDTL